MAIAGGTPLPGTALAEALGDDRPALAGDPAALAALAEHVRGAANGFDDVLYLHGGSGITAGIITGGQVVTGHRGLSGHVGHMIVNPAAVPAGADLAVAGKPRYAPAVTASAGSGTVAPTWSTS